MTTKLLNMKKARIADKSQMKSYKASDKLFSEKLIKMDKKMGGYHPW